MQFLGLFIMAFFGLFTPTPAKTAETAHSFQFTQIDEQSPLPLSQFKGKVLLVVNTASKCGFTPQYNDLQKLYDMYKDRGLVVLGVPANNFGQQEPGSNADITEFCETNFNITFPMTAKESVTGADAHPFYKWAEQYAGKLGKPRWNFHKYLIAPDGRFVDWFSSPTSPVSDKVKNKIEALLPATHD